MKRVTFFLTTVLVFAGAIISKAQDDTNQSSHQVSVTIPKVALVDIEANGGEASSIDLTDANLLTNLEAGEAIDFSKVKNTDLWLNYTSIVGSEESRDVQVSLDQALPAGISIRLTASSSTTHTGTAGTPSEDGIVLSTTNQDLITGIGTVFTGNGANKGHQLTFDLEVDDSEYENIIAQKITRTVYYTITGDNDNVTND